MNWLFNAFPQEVVSAVGWTLLHSLWQGGIISIFLYLVLYIFRDKKAEMKTLISVAALILFIASAFLTYGFLINAQKSEVLEHKEHYSAIQKDAPVSTNEMADSQKGLGTELSVFYSNVKQYLNNNVEYIFALWLSGFSFFVIRLFGGLLLMTRTRKYALLIEESSWNEYINRLCKKINLIKRIEFGESKSLKVPVAMGFFKPIILLPFGLLSGLPQEQIEAIIAHEIAHIKRYDIFINLFQSAAEIVFFFNPFVWWISGRIRLEREYCCDDIAISQCGDELIYAKALANLESLVESNMPLFAVPLFKNHNQLIRRINRMLQQDKNRNNFKEKFIAAIIFMGLLVSAAIYKNANAQSVPYSNNAGFISASGTDVVSMYTPDGFDSTKAKKGSMKMTFDVNENGTKKEYRATLKNGELVSLFIDDEKIPKEDFGKYKDLINKRVKEHEAEMAKHEIEMKQHDAEMKQHEIEMKQHDKKMKEMQKELEKEAKVRDKEMKQHEKDMEKHQQEMKQHEKEMAMHQEDMKKHELEMKQHDKEMKVHEAEMKKHDAFMKDLKRMLVDEKIIGADETNTSMNFTGKKLIINGKEMSSSILMKAKKLYKEHFNKEVNDNANFNVNYNND